jgi:ABC-2 type transport system ATP-binding protein
VLRLDDVSKRFGERRALDRLSVAVPPGEVVGLLGPNGSGKTTAMRIVFGVVDPDGGRVLYEDRPLDPERRRRFGYMPEERGLYPRMTVRDHLVYLARITGMAAPHARAATERLMEELDIADRAGDRIEQLSLGNQQRVQLAAALVHDPDVLVLDEPFSGLDPVAVAGLTETLARRAAAGGTVLFSSHQLDLVESLCESVVVIDSGRLVMSGRVHELKRASGQRRLRLELEGADGTAWARSLPGVSAVGANGAGGGLRLALEPEADPLRVLDAARAAGTVHDFALELPSLNELFLEAVERAPR